MTWVRLDDRFWSNPKVRRAWRLAPRAIGLHVMALTYCAMHETDGVVDDEFVDTMLTAARDRKPTLDALTNAGLWHVSSQAGFWVINDYLDFNPSRAQLNERRRKDSERKRRRNPDGIQTESERSPNGIPAESTRNPLGSISDSERNPLGLTRAGALPQASPAARPGPSRPDPEQHD